MSIVERLIPEFVFEWSLYFKTAVLILGATILLFASYIRPEVSILYWGPIFLFGGLIEWVMVATVHVQIQNLDEDIEQTYEKVKEAERDILETRDKAETTQTQVKGLARETYDLDRTEYFDSLEPGGHTPPGQVDLSYEESPRERLEELERRVQAIEREIQ